MNSQIPPRQISFSELKTLVFFLMDINKGVWNIMEKESTRPALPYDYTIYMLWIRNICLMYKYRVHRLQSINIHMVRRACVMVDSFSLILHTPCYQGEYSHFNARTNEHCKWQISLLPRQVSVVDAMRLQMFIVHDRSDCYLDKSLS